MINWGWDSALFETSSKEDRIAKKQLHNSLWLCYALPSLSLFFNVADSVSLMRNHKYQLSSLKFNSMFAGLVSNSL